MGPIDFGKSMKVIHIFKLLRKYGILTTEKKNIYEGPNKKHQTKKNKNKPTSYFYENPILQKTKSEVL